MMAVFSGCMSQSYFCSQRTSSYLPYTRLSNKSGRLDVTSGVWRIYNICVLLRPWVRQDVSGLCSQLTISVGPSPGAHALIYMFGIVIMTPAGQYPWIEAMLVRLGSRVVCFSLTIQNRPASSSSPFMASL